ncbi:DHA2 family efflux MFS transporter permease subunit [Nocardioides daejeonensis]|uniref:DHA2 family efflux MFS transporter permease subunit n=1 Tax=Nocardioides daejeonensis TaxID=1046556 RepID=UPI000D750469|nr:DHA2 family efflux MFS transporter permease subunit [Nocardioides daejeonensis]
MSESVLPRDEQAPAQRHLGWALVLISTAQLMVVLDSTIANIALPHIKTDLHFSDANLQWIVTGYALAFGGFLLLGGRLGDLYGRRRIFMTGVTVFAIASLLGGFAQNELMLLGSRGLQGLGAAMASPAALALIATTFPAGPARSRAFAVYAAVSGVGGAVGLLLGGWLTGSDLSVFGHHLSGWRLTFLFNVPIGLVAAAMAPRVLPESERHTGWLDVPGAITATLGLLSIVFGLSRAAEADYGWDAPSTWLFLAVGVALLVAFLMLETRQEHPLLPFRVFSNRTRAASFVAMMFMPAAMFATFYFLSLFIQDVVGYSPLKTGFAFLPFPLGMVIAATASSKLIGRVDPRFLAGPGTLVAAFAMFMYSRITVDDSPAHLAKVALDGGHLGADTINYWTDLLPWIFLMALGMGFTFIPLTLTAVHHLRLEDTGIGSGVLNTMQQVGGAIGLATLATVSIHAATDWFSGLKPAPQGQDPALIHRFQEVAGQAAFTQGATTAFLAGSVLVLIASAVVWSTLNVKHTELATDGPGAAAPH